MAYQSLQDRVVLVTGGTRGLGRVMALALVDAGANVFIIARDADQVASTVEEARLLGKGGCEGICADIGRDEDCRSAVEAAAREFGPVQVLINNAAIAGGGQQPQGPTPFWDRDFAGMEQMINVNLVGTYRMFCHAVPSMVENGFGKIITITTSRPSMKRPFSGPYGPIKAALESTTLIWAHELEGTGVTANVLLPGGLTDTSLVPGPNAGKRAKPFAAGKGPLGLEGTNTEMMPAEIMAPPILWLASDESNEVSGRRVVARDWDPDLPAAQAADRAMPKPSDAPMIM